MASNIIPSVSFESLGELPQLWEQARLREAERAATSGADVRSVRGLEDLSSRLYQAGSFQAAAQAAQQAATRRAIEQRAEADKLNLEWLRANLGKTTPTVTPAPQQTLEDLIGGTAPARPAVPSSPLFGASPGALPSPSVFGPRSELPPTPTEQMITAAQAGPAPSAPLGPQLAGPPPPPPGPPEISPYTIQGAGAPAVPAPSAPAAQPLVPMGAPAQAQGAAQEIRELYDRIGGMPPKSANTPQFKAYMSQFTNALGRANLKPEEVSYQQERLYRANEGLPDITRHQFELDPKVVGERLQGMERTYKYYQEKGQGADAVVQKGEILRRVLDDPRYVPGESSAQLQPWVDSAVRGAISATRTLQAYGVPVPVSEDQIAKITEPTALRELVSSLKNQLTIAGLGGSLGNRISDADAARMETTVATLGTSPRGSQLINEINIELAKRAKIEQGYSAEYYRNNEYRGSAPGMDTHVQEKMKDYANRHPILVDDSGKLTTLGRKAEEVARAQAVPAGPVERRTIEMGGKRFWQYRDGRVEPQ